MKCWQDVAASSQQKGWVGGAWKYRNVWRSSFHADPCMYEYTDDLPANTFLYAKQLCALVLKISIVYATHDSHLRKVYKRLERERKRVYLYITPWPSPIFTWPVYTSCSLHWQEQQRSQNDKLALRMRCTSTTHYVKTLITVLVRKISVVQTPLMRSFSSQGFEITYPTYPGQVFEAKSPQQVSWVVDRDIPHSPDVIYRIRILNSTQHNQLVIGENLRELNSTSSCRSLAANFDLTLLLN